jgi:hypothetical protein
MGQPGTFPSFDDCSENDRGHENGEPDTDMPGLRRVDFPNLLNAASLAIG